MNIYLIDVYRALPIAAYRELCESASHRYWTAAPGSGRAWRGSDQRDDLYLAAFDEAKSGRPEKMAHFRAIDNAAKITRDERRSTTTEGPK
jgi:hypothetical protein